ncbi:Hypothetical predicted protein [Mytilus galloprovincialis]|uniref:Uncharacterized protein n=1 Tax=Mytilus galloprovincialis TaxID=29158 RepID=A0A8B6GX01_MYTGA|nr:Hypothetical predicted protein [Mytilus galloprovincialis]
MGKNLRSTINKYWTSELQESADTKSSLRFLNTTILEIGIVPPVWEFASESLLVVRKSMIKAGNLTGTDLVQADKYKFSQYKMHIKDYKLCGEKRERFMSKIQIKGCNEIQPCTDNYMQDLCKPCRAGMEQPDLISSTGNINKSSCFQPTTKCLARDITYSRTEKDVFCSSLKWCKCDTKKCYFGDPCLCDNKKPCAVGHTMNEKGVCSPCPKGTFKNVTGCGPCRQLNSVDSIHEKNSQSLQTEQYMNVKPQQQLSTETTFVGTQQDKPQDGRQDARHNHLSLLQNNHVNTIEIQTGDSYLNNKYLQSYSTDEGPSELISGVSHFKDLDNVRCDGSIEDQIDNLKLQVFSGGNKTNPLSDRRTLRRIPTESEDENSVATVPMYYVENKDVNCNNVLSNRDIKSGNTYVNEHFGCAYNQTRMQSYIQQGSSEEYVNNSYASGYKTSTLNYTKANNDPMSGSFITMHSPVFDSLATEELPSSIETYTFNINGNNGF